MSYGGPLSTVHQVAPTPTPGPVQTSGLQTADAAIKAEPGCLYGVIVTPAAADATLILYDNASAASGTVLAKILVKASTNSIHVPFNEPIVARAGIYADITGASAEYVVYYS